MGNKKTIAAVISGAPNNSSGFLNQNINPDNMFVICADSGYKKCLEAGIAPDLIIGDFDSAPVPEMQCEMITLPCVKDDSDTFFCVKKAAELGFAGIEIYNAVGSRADHTWANILCLDYCRKAGVLCHIVDEHNKIYTVTENAVIKQGKHKYFSVFAFLGRADGVSIKNARYEVDNISIEPFEQFALSNSFAGGDVFISVRQGTLLVIESSD